MISAPLLDEIRTMQVRLASLVRRTPVLELAPGELISDDGFDSTLVFKLELLQTTGTFKIRGALSVMLALSSDEKVRGVTAVSAGNHAIAVSYAARAIGTSAKIIMIKTANRARIELARQFGAEIELAEDGPSAFQRASEIQSREGRFFVHPFEGFRTVIGTGTLGLEFWEQVRHLDAIVVSVGGGGLIAGIAAAVKQLSPNTRVYGVEPVGADSMSKSFIAGAPVSLPVVNTIADSLAPPMATPYTFSVCKQFVDRIVLIDDEAMRQTMGIIYRDLKLAVEPAGAAALAAALGPLRSELQGRQRVGVVICGSNIDLRTFCSYTDR
jgi:threonine dehydratase